MIPLDQQTFDMYTAVARHFDARIQVIFNTEESLKATFAEYFSALPFDRTERWNTILARELEKSWHVCGPAVRSAMTLFDQNQILACLSWYLDYNLFTQVMLNLQPAYLLNYRSGDAEKTAEELKAKWAGQSPSPFDVKPKMFKVAGDENLSLAQQAFNRDLSTLKALRIVSGLTKARSFRVSPKGSTPALTDSENLSMLGIGGDQYLAPPEGFKAYYFTWAQTPNFLEEAGEKKFAAPFIPYLFESKSGGEMLNAALFARYIAMLIYVNLDPDLVKAVLPRINSVLLVTNAEPEEIRAVKESIGPSYDIRFHEGQRTDQVSEVNA